VFPVRGQKQTPAQPKNGTWNTGDREKRGALGSLKAKDQIRNMGRPGDTAGPDDPENSPSFRRRRDPAPDLDLMN
jgi:hypothetical protein